MVYFIVLFLLFVGAAGISHCLLKKKKNYSLLSFIFMCCGIICMILYADIIFTQSVYEDLLAYEIALNGKSSITLGEVLSSVSTIVSVCCTAALAGMGYYYFSGKSN